MTDTYDEETGEVIAPRNLRHWSQLFHTDPKHTKSTGGREEDERR